jgi:hypothetical protein
MDLKSPTGKEESLWVFSKRGAGGKELCGSFSAKSPEDTEDLRLIGGCVGTVAIA